MTENSQPLGGNEMQHFGGPSRFMRLAGITPLAHLDVAVVEVPFDFGTGYAAPGRTP